MTKRAHPLVPTLAFGLASTLSACDRTLPPLGEALVVVDTDLPVPSVVSRLRVDVYEDGIWKESRDLARPDPRDWPASFSVVAEDDGRVHEVVLRVRAYQEGATRTYRGERFAEGADVFRREAPSPAPGEAPRLLREGADVTPKDEPLPNLAVDRTTVLRLEKGVRFRTELLLSGDCAGTMSSGTLPTAATTCVQGARVSTASAPGEIDEVLETPNTSAVGTWGASPCASNASTRERVCVPGGAFVLGSRDADLVPAERPSPERVVRVSRFSVDRHEVTVARFRAARARGIALEAGVTEGPLTSDAVKACPYSASPRDREGYAMACVSFEAARDFCRAEGGRLPTESEWEWMAAAASGTKNLYPTGNEEPSCDDVVFGRIPLGGAPGVCGALSKLPVAVFGENGQGLQDRDVTSLGIVGLTGGVAEWTSDDYATFDADAWFDAGRTDPRITVTKKSAPKVVRGASWAAPVLYLKAAVRQSVAPSTSFGGLGLRCVYPAP